jgi:hypothetical protein
VDIYGRFDRGKVLRVIIGSCKLRLEAPASKISEEEVQNLVDRFKDASVEETEYCARRAKSYRDVVAILFTNAESTEDGALALAKRERVGIAQVKLPRAWVDDPTRHTIERSMVKFISGSGPKWIPKQGVDE